MIQVSTEAGSPHDPRWFRTVLGHFPTGVAVITAVGVNGPVGMAVGSFTSVSLNPPMVAFLPDRNSSTFPHIRNAGSFCVNILAADQAELCRQFAAKGTDKYAGVTWEPSPASAAPRLSGAVAWIDCDLADVHDAGDHYIVVGRVNALGVAEGHDPLLFFQGGYGRFSSLSLTAESDTGMVGLMRQIELVRPQIENIAAELDMEAIASTRHGNEMCIVACARTADVHGVPTRVGQRVPMIPPLGALLVAWAAESDQATWLDAIPRGGGQREEYVSLLKRVRERGWSLSLMSDAYARFQEALDQTSIHSPTDRQREQLNRASAHIRIQDSEPEDLNTLHEPTVRNIAAPVFDPDGSVAFILTLIRPQRMTLQDIEQKRGRILDTTAQMTHDLASTPTA